MKSKVNVAIVCLGLILALAFTASAVEPPLKVSDSYLHSVYYQRLCEALDNYADKPMQERFVQVALSQVGYRSSSYKGHLDGNGDGGKNANYQEYAYGTNLAYTQWCAEFVSWCAGMAGVPTSIIPRSAGTGSFREFPGTLRLWSDDFKTYQDYKPQRGDILLHMPDARGNWIGKDKNGNDIYEWYKHNNWEKSAHVAIVLDVLGRADDGGWIIKTVERLGQTVGIRTMEQGKPLSTAWTFNNKYRTGVHFYQAILSPKWPTPNIKWNNPVATDVSQTDAKIQYSFEYSNMVGTLDEISCTLTAPDLGKKWEYSIGKNVNLGAASGVYSNSIQAKTITDGTNLQPGYTYICTFSAVYTNPETNEEEPFTLEKPFTVTASPYIIQKKGNGQWFVVTGEPAEIKDTLTGLITLKKASPGEYFEVKSVKNDVVTVFYSGSKAGKLNLVDGDLYSPRKITVKSWDEDEIHIPIHKSYYGKSELIDEMPQHLAVGDTVTVLCEYQNKHDNLWYYIIDSRGHDGWVYSQNFFKPDKPEKTLVTEEGGTPVENPVVKNPESDKSAIWELAEKAKKIITDKINARNTLKKAGQDAKQAVTSGKVTGMNFRFNEPREEDENAFVSATAIPKGSNGTSRHWTGTGIRVTDTETGLAVPLYGNTVDQVHNYWKPDLNIWYDLRKELGAQLSPGTTYKYQFYTICDGETYWSPEQEFTTTGSRTCHVTFETDGGTIINPLDLRYKRTLPHFDMVKWEIIQHQVINYVFRGWYRDAAHTIPFTDTSLVMEDMTLYAKWELEKPIIDVTAITLNKPDKAIYSDSDDDLMTIEAVLLPADATFADVLWTTSDPQVANIDQYGHVVAIGPGTATITCASIMTPEVKSSCEVTVKQRMRFLYLEQDDFGFCTGDTFDLTTGHVPGNASETEVTWTSSDPSVVSVDGNGCVTANGLGEAVITVTSVENASLKASVTIRVEKPLALNLYPQATEYYLGGEANNTAAYVVATNNSIQRCMEEGWEWSVTTSGSSAEIKWETMQTVLPVNSVTGYADTGVRIDTTALKAAGKTTVMVTCTNIEGTETVSFDIDVADLNGAPAENVTLGTTEFDLSVGESVTIPNMPVATDGGALPAKFDLTLVGTSGLDRYTTTAEAENGQTIRFSESGVYCVDAIYTSNNISYTVPLTFNVADENGVVHMPVTEISITPEAFSLLLGEGTRLTATVDPENAWNKQIIWTSSDPTVAKVDEAGNVTTLSVGSAIITAVAADGQDASGSMTLNVENVVQLEDNHVTLDVYAGGQQEIELGDLPLTLNSYIRLSRTGEAISWELERISSGEPVTTVGIEDHGGYATLKLLRVIGPGNDTYRVTCRAGQHSDSCLLSLRVVEGALPTSISLTATEITANVDQTFTIDAMPQSTPALPEDTWFELTGGASLMNNISDLVYDGTDISAKIGKSGVYAAKLVYSGANYIYEIPLTLTIRDGSGSMPVMPDSLTLDREALFLTSGGTAVLAPVFSPENTTDQTMTWSSADEEIATVSQVGEVMAVSAGQTVVTGIHSVSGLAISCVVHVEDDLTLMENDQEYSAYVEGASRISLGGIWLTEASSLRLDAAPEWSLERLSGTNLTLRVSSAEKLNASGETIYGADIQLYSISGVGETVYGLTCAAGDETATATIIVNGRSRSTDLPDFVTVATSTYAGYVGELIQVIPEWVLSPEGTGLPAGFNAEWDYSTSFAEALNSDDCVFNRSISTFSFNEAGRFMANMVLRSGNMNYTIPITFNIRDASGAVPVNGEKMRLSATVLDLEEGETAALFPVFTPADVTNRNVTWMSSADSVATVNENGVVTAIAKGTATIICVPSDTHMTQKTCLVRVEDYLTAAAGTTSYSWYMDGAQENAAGAMVLTAGTVKRMKRDDLTAEWTLSRNSGEHAALELVELADGTGVNILTTALNSTGTDTYTLTLTAGTHTLSRTFKLDVLGSAGAPESVSIAKTAVTASVGTPINIDFTPICSPAGTSIPSEARPRYIGMSGFYKGLDSSASSYSNANSMVTLCFTKPGVYLLTRSYMSRNLKYVTACQISVGDSEESLGLIKASNTEYTVYLGGQAGPVSTISLTDGSAASLWGDSLRWNAEKISGDNVTATLETDDTSADLMVMDAAAPGIAVWRVTCDFGTISESVDITIRVKRPLYRIPTSIRLLTDRLSAAVGDTMVLPLIASCTPSGSRLPETGDAFWSFEADDSVKQNCEWEIGSNLLKITFTHSGYYAGRLIYRNGNVSYKAPVYFTVRDEENVAQKPDLRAYALNVPNTLYPEGETGIPIGVIMVGESMNAYGAGASTSYLAAQDAQWSVSSDEEKLTLSLSAATPNTRTLMLEAISGTGDAAYTVSCAVDGETYAVQGVIHIASDDEPRPDPTLARGTYTITVGDTVRINRALYSREDRSLLDSATEWNANSLLSAIGYEYQTDDTAWTATFYKEGTFRSSVSGRVGNICIEAPLSVIVNAPGDDYELPVMRFPGATSEIEAQAFEGSGVAVVDLRNTAIARIASGAFRNCLDLERVYLPDGNIAIAEDAFYGCMNVRFICSEGSAAATYAANHGIPVEP